MIIITRKNEDSIGTTQIDSNLQSILYEKTMKERKNKIKVYCVEILLIFAKIII